MLIVDLTSQARKSLMNIAIYTRKTWGKKQNDLYIKSIKDRFDLLAENPSLGIRRDEVLEGLRSYPEGSHVIFYIEKEKSILIADILHQNMNPSHYIESDTVH